MDSLFEIVHSGSLCALFLPVLLAIFVGHQIVDRHPRARAVGHALAWCALVAIALAECVIVPITDGGTLLEIMVRSLLGAGLMLGGAWILLPAILGVCDSIDSAIHWFIRRIIRPLVNAILWIPRWIWTWPARRRAAAQRLEFAKIANQERERNRVRETREAEIGRQRSVDQRRREFVRLQCQLLYDRHAKAISSVFPRKRFEAYIQTYFSDKDEASLIEERAELLKRMIEEFAASAPTAIRKSFGSLPELVAAFEARRAEVMAIPCDEEMKESLIAHLATQEDQALQEFLKP